ncbi:hypothetical protein BZZ01_05040 [Nostocales cyanobacterium HT-58-2]|nr:hypothetical protein BZZ01_05040 [Nostocales cyanobacterium HT-58-2]
MNFCISYYAGGGGFSLGAKAAGCKTLGVELDPAIAALYQANVGPCVVADVTTLDPHKLEFPSKSERRRSGSLLIWQLSPECKVFSRANTAAKKNCAQSLATASATSLTKIFWHEQIIEPDCIILENVEDYANYQGYIDFCNYLEERGYQILSRKLILNAADFGVPQSRRRLIMIAGKGVPLPKIEATHAQFLHGQMDLFSAPKLPWVGWYKAIEDLLPELPRSQLTPKQEKAIQALGLKTQLVDQQNSKSVRLGYKTRALNEPSFTHEGLTRKKNGQPYYNEDLTTPTDQQNEGCPLFSGTMRRGCNAQTKAFLVSGQQKGINGEREVGTDNEPIWTIPASISKGVPRALLIERVGAFNIPKTRSPQEPCWTLRCLGDDGKKGNRNKIIDAVMEGDVHSLNTRALARLQSFPDSYQWSGKSALDTKVIGNSVPPLMAQRIIEALKKYEN